MTTRTKPTCPTDALGKLVEELGELQQACGKSLRFGANSVNPDVVGAQDEYDFFGHGAHHEAPALGEAVRLAHPRETNREWLLREMEDVEAAIAEMRRWL